MNRMPTTALMAAAIVFVACAAPRTAVATWITNGSFEDHPIGTSFGQTGTFAATGEWTIDVWAVAGAENGVTPLDGTRMLRFLGPGQSTNIYQLIDVTALAGTIDAGQATATLSAFVNTVSPNGHDFWLSFLAYDESAVPLNFNDFDDVSAGPVVRADGDVATWEQMSFQYVIPQNTRLLAVGLNSDWHVGLPISYADQVSLSINGAVPEPSGLALLGLGALGLIGYSRNLRRPRRVNQRA